MVWEKNPTFGDQKCQKKRTENRGDRGRVSFTPPHPEMPVITRIAKTGKPHQGWLEQESVARGWLQVEASGRGTGRMKYTPRLALLPSPKSSASTLPWAKPAGSPRAGSGRVVCREQPRRAQSWRRGEPDVHGMTSMWLVSWLPLCPRLASPQRSQSKGPSRATAPPPGNGGGMRAKDNTSLPVPQHPETSFQKVDLAASSCWPHLFSDSVFPPLAAAGQQRPLDIAAVSPCHCAPPGLVIYAGRPRFITGMLGSSLRPADLCSTPSSFQSLP